MKKNILQPEVKEELISRINKLSSYAKNEWGKMNVNQMLRHGHDGVLISYGDIKPSRKSGWIQQKMMRFFIFNTDAPTPKGKAQTFPEINMVERGINPADFEKEKQALINIIKNFPSKPLYPESTMLGKMTKENWARLNYSHLDHHLKQFGV